MKLLTFLLVWTLTSGLICGSTLNFNSGSSSLIRRSVTGWFEGVSRSVRNGNTNDGRIIFEENISGKREVSTEKADEMFRKKLCASARSTDFLYHKKTEKCYQVASRGPCGENMAFYKDNGSAVYGECDCAYNQGVPLVYHEKTNKCYYVYQQAYCQRGYWLAFNRRGQAGCEKNKCLNARNKNGSWIVNMKPDIVPFRGNGECVKLSSRETCPVNKVITFLSNHVWPSCGTLEIEIKHISPVGSLPCPPGSILSITGRCSPIIEWDF